MPPARDREPDPGLGGGLLEPLALVADDRVERDRLVERAPGFEPRQVEQVRDDPRQARGLAFELRGEPGDHRGVLAGGRPDRLGGGLDRGRRGLQLVRGVRDEVAPDLVQPSGLRDVADHQHDRAVLRRGREPTEHARWVPRSRPRSTRTACVVGGPLGRCVGAPAGAGRRSRPAGRPRWPSAAGFASRVAPSGPNRRTPSSIEASDVVGRVALRPRTPRAGPAASGRPPRLAAVARRARAVRRSAEHERDQGGDRDRHRAASHDERRRPSMRSVEAAGRRPVRTSIVHLPVRVHLAFIRRRGSFTVGG